MNVNELMIGDYIRQKHSNLVLKVSAITPPYVQCEGENGQFHEDTIEPILLSVEILEKNEFAYCISNGCCVGYFDESYSNQTMEVLIFNVKSEYRNNQLHICDANNDNRVMLHLMACNFVHELQHVFRTCGINKEIKL